MKRSCLDLAVDCAPPSRWRAPCHDADRIFPFCLLCCRSLFL